MTTTPFNPLGQGYDDQSAFFYGLQPDATGHWQSRIPETGLILKGAGHPTFNPTQQVEDLAGYEIYQGLDGRLYSRPKGERIPTDQSQQGVKTFMEDLWKQMGTKAPKKKVSPDDIIVGQTEKEGGSGVTGTGSKGEASSKAGASNGISSFDFGNLGAAVGGAVGVNNPRSQNLGEVLGYAMAGPEAAAGYGNFGGSGWGTSTGTLNFSSGLGAAIANAAMAGAKSGLTTGNPMAGMQTAGMGVGNYGAMNLGQAVANALGLPGAKGYNAIAGLSQTLGINPYNLGTVGSWLGNQAIGALPGVTSSVLNSLGIPGLGLAIPGAQAIMGMINGQNTSMNWGQIAAQLASMGIGLGLGGPIGGVVGSLFGQFAAPLAGRGIQALAEAVGLANPSGPTVNPAELANWSLADLANMSPGALATLGYTSAPNTWGMDPTTLNDLGIGRDMSDYAAANAAAQAQAAAQAGWDAIAAAQGYGSGNTADYSSGWATGSLAEALGLPDSGGQSTGAWSTGSTGNTGYAGTGSGGYGNTGDAEAI